MGLSDKVKTGLKIATVVGAGLLASGCNPVVRDYLVATAIDEGYRHQVRNTMGYNSNNSGSNNEPSQAPRITAKRWDDSNGDGIPDAGEVFENIPGPIDISQYGVNFELQGGGNFKTLYVHDANIAGPNNGVFSQAYSQIKKGTSLPKKIEVMIADQDYNYTEQIFNIK